MEFLKYLYLILFSLSTLLVNAASSDSLFTLANTAYEADEYTRAIALYESIRSGTRHSAELYYNLGNSYYQEGAIAKSILHYERAILLAPQDKNTLHNLSIAKERTEQTSSLPTLFFKKWWLQFSQLLSLEHWRTLLLLLLWASAIFTLYFLRGKKKQHFQMLLLCLACLLLTFAVQRKSENETNKRFGIALTSEELYHTPSLNASISKTLPLGNKVQILSNKKHWLFIQLSDGHQAWILQEAVAEI